MANKRPTLRVAEGGGKADAFAPVERRARLPSGPYRKEDAGKLTEAKQREMQSIEQHIGREPGGDSEASSSSLREAIYVHLDRLFD
jgi:hypothetical protein